MESNDTLLTATQTNISAGNIGDFTFSGTIGDNVEIGSAADVDLFELELSENTDVFFDITANDINDVFDDTTLNSILRVFDAEGNELDVNDDSLEAIPFSFVDSFIAFRPPTTGKYFVGVSGFSNFGYSPTVAGSSSDSASTGDYGLEITIEDRTKDLSGGVQLLRDINSDTFFYSPYGYEFNVTEVNGQLFFVVDDGENGRELWVSDETSEGTQLLQDINPGRYSSYIFSFQPGLNSQLFFVANDGETGNELWVSDGTAEGTQLIQDINLGNSSSVSYYANLFEFNGQLFFSADDGEVGEELWVSDGTAEGTQLIQDINPGSSSSDVSVLGEFNDQLFFAANDGESGRELWVSDGTAEGTQLLKDINPGSSSSFSYFDAAIEFNGQLFFTADDGQSGRELWVSDGTTEGTQLVQDINPGSSSSFVYIISDLSGRSDFTEVNGQLFFTADDGEMGDELWVSDGTAEGTQLVKDINPGRNAYIRYLTEVNGQLFFTADDGEAGDELWVSDGTTEGTQLVKDITPENRSYYFRNLPSNLTAAGDLLFFTATSAFNGKELWVNGTDLRR